MYFYEAISKYLLEAEIDTVFGLMGDANMWYATEYQSRGGRFIDVTHEASAVAMADAYHRFTGRVGVASVTHGPGLTNTLTSLTEAVRQRSEVVLITGETPPEPTHYQRLDLASAATVAGAAYERVGRPDSLGRDMNRAFQRARSERRPVLLNLPLDFMFAEVEEQPVVRPLSTAGPGFDEANLDATVGLLASVRRPIILGGRGAILTGAEPELETLAEQLGGLLASTVLGKGLFANHPRNLGIMGSFSHSVAADAIAEADCIIAFGASLNSYTTFHGDLTTGKSIVHVDVDASKVGEFTPVTVGVVGDAHAVAAQIGSMLREIDHQPRGQKWAERYERALADRSPWDEFTDRSGNRTVDPRAATVRLNELLDSSRTTVSDIGRFVAGAWPYFDVAAPEDFTTMGAYGSIGLGLAGAIGAAIARPDRHTVALLGDGGFMMSLGEFATAVREKLPLVVVVFNDGAYGAEYFRLERRGMDATVSELAWPELAALAVAMGAHGLTITKLSDLDHVPQTISQLTGPLLIDIKLDPRVNVANWE